MLTFEETKRGYANLWKKGQVRPERRAAVTAIAKRFFPVRARYTAVEKLTGVPDWWIFCAHIRESNGSFAGVLHNGEHIIGTGKKTRLVPAGRGPFSSWEDAAVDALRIKGLHKITDWNAARALYEWERFNGQGYFGKGVNSSYDWADTSLEQTGKYTSDHHFDPNFDDPQVGCAALLKILCELDPKINARVNAVPIPVPRPPPDVEPVEKPNKPAVKPPVTDILKSKTVWSTIVGYITSVFAVVSEPKVQIACLVIAALFAAYIIYERRKKQVNLGV